MTSTQGWFRCQTCGTRIEVGSDVGVTPDCPRCGTRPPPLQPIEIVPEHPVGPGDPELGTPTPGPELAAAQLEILNLNRVVDRMTSDMGDAQQVILDQQTDIADLRTQLTHALADAADQANPASTDPPGIEGSGI